MEIVSALHEPSKYHCDLKMNSLYTIDIVDEVKGCCYGMPRDCRFTKMTSNEFEFYFFDIYYATLPNVLRSKKACRTETANLQYTKHL